MDKLFLWISELSPSFKAWTAGISLILTVYFVAILESPFQKIWSDNSETRVWGVVWFLIVIIVAIIWGTINLKYRKFLEANRDKSEIQRRVIENAREHITELTLQQLTKCDAIVEKSTVSTEEFRSALICDKERIDNLIKAAWEVVNANHNVSISPTERINFEITLITHSIIDSELTVAAWRRRDGRSPKSLQIRNDGELKLFDRTEAAKMMANIITETRIIEDTSEPSENYESLYEGQRSRIRSSVLYPILTPKCKPLGVFVLHCEVPGFFEAADRRYWHELLSVFSSPIALEIERINAYNKANLPLSAPIEKYQPY